MVRIIRGGGEQRNNYKVIIVGESSVGKSCISNRFADLPFSDKCSSTVGIEFQARYFELDDGEMIKLQVWDTSGTERFRCATKSFYRASNGVLIVFDLTNRKSFEACITYWINEVKETVLNENQIQSVIYLVGSKSDLIDTRQVSYAEAHKLATEHKLIYYETSSKDNTNIQMMFKDLAKQMVEQEKLHINHETPVYLEGDNNSNRHSTIRTNCTC